MKKIIVVMLAVLLFLGGCTIEIKPLSESGNTETEAQQNVQIPESKPTEQPAESKPNELGLWQHKEYPNAYSIIIYEKTQSKISFIIESVRGNYAQIAMSKLENVDLNGNVCEFSFTDSFGNTGVGMLVLKGEEISITYNTNQPYQGGWCIDAGEGSYKKVKGLEDMQNFNPGDYETFSPEDFDYMKEPEPKPEPPKPVAPPSTQNQAWPATSNIKTYVKSTGDNTIVYESPTSQTKYGAIYAADLITILGYDWNSGRLIVNYPTSGGKTKTGYIRLSDVTDGAFNSADAVWQAGGKITAYRRAGGGAEIGYISPGDTVYTVARSGGFIQVIYPIAGGYKMGWIAG